VQNLVAIVVVLRDSHRSPGDLCELHWLPYLVQNIIHDSLFHLQNTFYRSVCVYAIIAQSVHTLLYFTFSQPTPPSATSGFHSHQ